MHSIKKILLTGITFFSVSSICQEIMLPEEVWQPIVIYALIEKPSDAGNLAFASKQLYTIIQLPHVIKTAVMHRKDKIITHYETARRMRVPAITKKYVDANEKLLTTLELLIYQEALKPNPYADINYEGKERRNRLEMICSDYPEYKLNWIEWLTQNGARENNTHVPERTALGTVIKRYKGHHECNRAECNLCFQTKDTYYTLAKMLLENGGANPSLHIHEAIDARHAPTVQLLIDSGASIKHHNYEWFHDYLHQGNNIDEHTLLFLLDQGYNPYTQGVRTQFGYELDNAVQIVQRQRFNPSATKDRILDLLRQYPKNKTE